MASESGRVGFGERRAGELASRASRASLLGAEGFICSSFRRCAGASSEPKQARNPRATCEFLAWRSDCVVASNSTWLTRICSDRIRFQTDSSIGIAGSVANYAPFALLSLRA